MAKGRTPGIEASLVYFIRISTAPNLGVSFEIIRGKFSQDMLVASEAGCHEYE
jgi:hypothetical protein